jgi:hypothetical protein
MPTSCELITESLKCPPSGIANPTTKPQVAVQLTTVATILEDSYRLIPTVPGHQSVDLLMVATAPVALAVITISSLTAILAAEAATAGAPCTGLAEELGAEATTAAEATRTPTPPVYHAAASMPPPKNRRTTTQKVLHGRRQRRLPRLLCTASQSTSPGEIQTSRDHQVRREARSNTVAQMLRPLHRKCWWQ